MAKMKMKCMNCGKELGAKEAYCKKCGLPIPGRANKLKQVSNSENEKIDSELSDDLKVFILSLVFGFHNISIVPGGIFIILSYLLPPLEDVLELIFKILFFNNISICIFILLNIMSVVGIVILSIKNPQRKDLRIKMVTVLSLAIILYLCEIFVFGLDTLFL